VQIRGKSHRRQGTNLFAVRNDGRMLSDEELSSIADRLLAVGGIVGVTLGGSRARGAALPGSDVDLGLYYRGDLDIDALGALARELSGPDAQVTAVGGWGPRVNGGGWLTIGGQAVDWIYRDLDEVDACWRRARRGEVVLHIQVGHPAGFPDWAYAGELALAVVLADPTGELGTRRAEMTHYPRALAQAQQRGLREADFSLSIAGKAIGRADAAYIAGCLFRAVTVCVHALHGAAGVWVINEKGAVASAARLPGCPADFEHRVQAMMGGVGTSAAELGRTLAAAAAVVAAVKAALGEVSALGDVPRGLGGASGVASGTGG
jgi:predicted nucleotidyltransferase